MHRLFLLPNLVSLARLPLAVAFVLLEEREARLALIVAAAGSDFLDGWLARRGRGSSLGAVLDPITDKTFWLTAVITFAVQGPLRLLELLVLLSRDIAVALGLAIVLLRHAPMRFRARLSGKVATGVQFAALLALVAAPSLRLPVVIAVGLVSAVAIWDYGREAVRALRMPQHAH